MVQISSYWANKKHAFHGIILFVAVTIIGEQVLFIVFLKTLGRVMFSSKINAQIAMEPPDKTLSNVRSGEKHIKY